MPREMPNFAVLLGPTIGSLPDAARPGLLARLERSAAERYRAWSEQLPEHADLLHRCAEREDEIANRATKLFPQDPDHADAIEQVLPRARELYYAVFADHSLTRQLEIQADAERQGAAAWRGLASQQEDASVAHELEVIARLEEVSADRLGELLATRSVDRER